MNSAQGLLAADDAALEREHKRRRLEAETGRVEAEALAKAQQAQAEAQQAQAEAQVAVGLQMGCNQRSGKMWYLIYTAIRYHLLSLIAPNMRSRLLCALVLP